MKTLAQVALLMTLGSTVFSTTQIPPQRKIEPVERSISHTDYAKLYRIFTVEALKCAEITKLKSEGYVPALLIRNDELKGMLSSLGAIQSVIIDPDCISSEEGIIDKKTGTKLVLIHISISTIAPPLAEGEALIEVAANRSKNLHLIATSLRSDWLVKTENETEPNQ